ncbi:SCO family protein [Sorangium sp. So ce321]|uniref:SCO family protein n=1 Tax=Sorangium sp. So ce321 TaxID=3133300 RepID=UPI003F614A0A
MTRDHRAGARVALAAAVALCFAAGCKEPRSDLGPRSEAAPSPRAGAEQPLGRLALPDVALRNEKGERVQLYPDLVKGRTVVMSFIFTRCTTVCPPIGAIFSRLRQQLGPRAGKDVSLLSVTLDPLHDTPAELRAWAERFGTGPGWSLLTGEPEDIDRLLKALGVYSAAREEHAPIVLVGDDRSGEWTRAYGLTSPSSLMDIVDRKRGGAPLLRQGGGG